MIRCQARIWKEFKTKKAAVVWPKCVSGDNPDALQYPECGGEVSLAIRAVDEPSWGGTYAKLEIDAKCSRCATPYFDGWLELQTDDGALLAKIAAEHYWNSEEPREVGGE